MMFKRKVLIILATLMATNMLYAAEMSSSNSEMNEMPAMKMKSSDQSMKMQKEMDSMMQAMHKKVMSAKTSVEMQKIISEQMHMMNKMMVKELGPRDANYEKRFIDVMIEHHEGAVMMAKDALKNANRPELIQMAKDIIAAQEKEISQMKEWRKQWYNQ
jgi:uncharacterized protein (DUF305 family)